MRQRNTMTGFDMEQHSLPDTPPPVNPIPTFVPYDNNNSLFNGLPQYHPPLPPHHHQQRGASNLGPGMSTPPNLYPLPYAPFNHGGVHESNPHFMGQGYKRKSDEVMPGNHQYLAEPPLPPCSFPHYPTPHPQPVVDQRSVRSRVGGAVSMDPPYFQGNQPFPIPPPGPIWYDQHCNNDNTSDGSSSHWLQPPYIPFMSGSAVPRYHEASSSSRNDVPFSYPSPNFFSHHLARPPPTVYPPRMASASYNVPVTIHDASYRNGGPGQPTGLRINQQHPRDDFSPAATLRHRGLPHLRAFHAHEEAFFGEGDFDDDYVDDHQDMRLDIEDMSYEELLDLGDHIGTVKTGLSEETVKDLVKRRTYISTRINLEEAPPSTDLETDSCTICQENYQNRDKIVTLDCKHEYHPECLEKWLVIKNICPICKSEALVIEKNKER